MFCSIDESSSVFWVSHYDICDVHARTTMTIQTMATITTVATPPGIEIQNAGSVEISISPKKRKNNMI